jgi:hypothetical protein
MAITKDEKNRRRREYRKNNIEKCLKKDAEYREKYKEKRHINFKLYYEKNKEKLLNSRREYLKKYRQEHRKEKNKYSYIKYNNDVNYKLNVSMRSRLHISIKNGYKSGSAVKDLGCTIPELKIHLEKQFKEGMSWSNWSKNGWHIDHINPLDNFNLLNREELLKAVNYKNLQPLWAEENLIKSNKILWKK